MSRTMVLFYVFTLPFVFLKDNGNSVDHLVEHCMMVFLLTYGYDGSLKCHTPNGTLHTDHHFLFLLFVPKNMQLYGAGNCIY